MKVDQVLALDATLARKGFPPLSPFWRETIERFYASGRRQLTVRVGRRGGKSLTLCKIAVAEALLGEHQIPRGDVGVVAFVSVSRDEAQSRLHTIREMLTALGVPFEPSGDGGIALVGRPVKFRTFACTVAAVSGFTAVLVIADELAKWRDGDGANPAGEVLASLRPTTATVRTARIVLSSSAFGTEDAHYAAFEQGETDFQVTAAAPSWVANESLTEQWTRTLEPDDRTWLREYGNIPSATASSAFDLEAIDRAFAPRDLTFCRQASPALVIDPSSGRADAWTYAVVRWCTPKVEPEYIERVVQRYEPWRDEGERIVEVTERVLTSSGAPIPNPDHTTDPPRPFLRFEEVGGWEGRFFQQLRGDAIVDQLATICRQRGIVDVHADQRESLMLASAFTARGLRYHSHGWTAENKTRAVATARRWMRDGELSLCDHAALRTQLLQFEERITSAGAFTYGARGGRHDDYVALLITAALADEAGLLPFSTLARPRIRRAMPWGHVA